MDAETKQLLDSLIQKNAGDKDAYALTYTNFSRKDLMHESGGKVYGNWKPSFSGACIDPNIKYLEKGAIIKLKDVGNCDGGYRIVMCESY